MRILTMISDSGKMVIPKIIGEYIKDQKVAQKLGLTATLNVGKYLPKFIDEWDEDSSYFGVQVYNPNPQSSYIKFYAAIGLSGTDSLLFEGGSDIHIDTIWPGFNFFTFDRICPEFYSIYSDEFIQHYELGSGLDTGNYFVYFDIMDTLFEDKLYHDSVTFFVHDTTSASCIWPYDNTKIFSGLLDSLYFTWTNSNYISSCNYELEVFLIPNGKDEYYAVDSTTAIFQQLFPSNLCFSSLLNASLLEGNKYAWRVKTKLFGTNFLTGNNHGKSVPFVFEITGNSADTGYKLYKNNPCFLGGFETGNFDGWKGSIGNHSENDTWKRDKFLLTNEGLNADNHFITQNGTNDIKIETLSTVPISGGNNAARIGDLVNGGLYASIRRSFTVTDQNSSFTVRMAGVLENPTQGHNNNNQPVLLFRVYTKKTYYKRRLIKTASRSYVSGNHPSFEVINGLQVLPWNCYTVNLSKYKGKTVTIEFISADCSLDAHFGYGYFDVCGNPFAQAKLNLNDSVFCKSDSIIASGDSSINSNEYRWELIQSNSSGEDLYLLREHSQFGIPGTINVKQFGLNNVSCNTWFKVKLSVKNDCSNWNTTEKLFKIQCPDLEHLDSEFCCPSFDCSGLNVGSTGLSGYSYLWGPELNRSCLSSYIIPNPVFNSECLNFFPANGYPLIYNVTITDNFGCTDEKNIYIYGNPPNGSIDTQMVCCGAKLKSVNGSERNHVFSWYKNSVSPENFISNEQEIEVSPSTTTTYYLKLSNACGDHISSVTVSAQSVKKGDIDTLTFNNSIHNDLDFIVKYINASNPNSKYNATNWAIYYLGRWGHSDWAEPSEPVASGSNCNGFENGDIKWDCKVNGTRLTPGVHNIRLVITNCDRINNTKYLDVSCTTTPYILRNLKYECKGKISSWVWKFYENHIPFNGLEKCDCYTGKTDNCQKEDASTKVSTILPMGQCICKKHKVAAGCLVPNIETSKTCIVLYVE